MASKLLPGEFRKRGLVTIEMDRFQASLFAPAKLKALDEARPGQALRDSVAIEENYVVSAHRLDGFWDYTIEHDGVQYQIPGQVFDRLMSYREAIITEGRKARGKETAARRKQPVAEESENLDVDAGWLLVNSENEV